MSLSTFIFIQIFIMMVVVQSLSPGRIQHKIDHDSSSGFHGLVAAAGEHYYTSFVFFIF